MKKLSKNKFKQSFKTGAFKKGSYSAGIIAIVLAIVVVVNLFVKNLPDQYTSYDMTKEKLYTIGSQTKKILKNLDTDVTIYQIAASGSEDKYIKKLLERYEGYSDKIKYKTLDPDIQIGMIKSFEGAEDLADNSLIVVNDDNDKFKLVSYDDIYEQDYSAYYYSGSSSYDFDGEGEVTSAISYVASENSKKMYMLSGHGEQELGETLTASIDKLNVATESLSLVTTGTDNSDEGIVNKGTLSEASASIPEDCDILMIYGPSTDCTEAEAEAIINYLKKGGDAIICIDYTGSEMPNFDKVLAAYGVKYGTGYVIEKNKSNYYQYQYYLLPDIQSTDITSSMDANSYALVPVTRAIETLDGNRDSLTISGVLKSSTQSYEDVDYAENATSLSKDKDDVDGPFDVAVTIEENLADVEEDTASDSSSADAENTDTTDTSETTEDSSLTDNTETSDDTAASEETTKMFVTGSYYMFSDDLTSQVTVVNDDLITNTITWMAGTTETSVSIATKSLDTKYNTVSAGKAHSYTALFCIVIPLAIVVAGFVIWIRRGRYEIKKND